MHWISGESAIPTTPDEAARHLQTIWRDSLSAKLKDNLHHKLLERQISETNRLRAAKTTIAAACKHVTDTLAQSEWKTLFVFGNLPALRGDRPAWTVTHSGDFGCGFEACFADDSGELLFYGSYLKAKSRNA